MVASARVDAFPRVTFHGRLSQLRISPTTTNGVVTYQAVIDIANPQNRLRPGMTATITVITAQRSDVLRVPNAALRYQPGESGLPGRTAGLLAGSNSSGAPPPALDPVDDDANDRVTRGSVYIVHGTSGAARVIVSVGITDGRQTEIEGPGIAAGQQVILDETDAQTKPRGPGGPRMF
jgi:HlyD family secretion protein